uniref:Uncharacterized protein n=1 Tax=Podoviridae sp. ctn7K25 TaxID=2825273 RepID=A0A8S5QBK7_9CAUD|nr:MAG TPA: hypothetical protein [Podoviridae sp. ctn7K25]
MKKVVARNTTTAQKGSDSFSKAQPQVPTAQKGLVRPSEAQFHQTHSPSSKKTTAATISSMPTSTPSRAKAL